MNSRIEKLVDKWANEENDPIYRFINTKIKFLGAELFHDYEPTIGSNFSTRLEKWILNAGNNNDQKTLFKLLPYIFYVGKKEYNNLQRVAYNEIIARWLIDTDHISLDDFNLAKKSVISSVSKSWICPITDSMDINSFHHINNIPGNIDIRPQWYSVDPVASGYVDYIKKHNLEKLILIEDFVGSGSQIEKTVKNVMDLHLGIPVLLLTILNCPEGAKRFNKLQDKYSDLTYKSVIELSSQCFVLKDPVNGEPSDFAAIRELIKRLYLKTSGNIVEGAEKPYSPFGYQKTGGLVIKFSNTPDNSIPAIHNSSSTWNPLFLRHSRN